jgi:hypothetical protein
MQCCAMRCQHLQDICSRKEGKCSGVPHDRQKLWKNVWHTNARAKIFPSKLSHKALIHHYQKHHPNEIWMESGEFPNSRSKWHPKRPRLINLFSVLPSIFARVLRHVLTQNIIALKRVHEPTDEIWIPFFCIWANPNMRPFFKFGNKFQPSFVMGIVVHNDIAKFMVGMF